MSYVQTLLQLLFDRFRNQLVNKVENLQLSVCWGAKKLHTHWLKNCQLQVLRKMHYPQNCVFIQHDPKISDWAVNSSRKWFPGLAPGFNRKKSRFSSTPFKTRFFWLAVYYSQGVTSRWVYLRWPYKEITPLWHHRSKSKKKQYFWAVWAFGSQGFLFIHQPDLCLQWTSTFSTGNLWQENKESCFVSVSVTAVRYLRL